LNPRNTLLPSEREIPGTDLQRKGGGLAFIPLPAAPQCFIAERSAHFVEVDPNDTKTLLTA